MMYWGKSIREVFSDADAFGITDIIRRVYQTDNPEHLPPSKYTDNRISGWRDNYIYKLPSGEVVAMYDDVSEIIENQMALNESVERFRTLFESTLDAILILDKQGVIECNQASVDMFHFDDKQQIMGQSILQLSPESQLDGTDSDHTD